MTGPVFDEPSRAAFEHGWDWFSLHAAQRMQAFNFFLVATAFIVAAYGTVLEKHPAVAVGMSLLGAWIAFWFNRLERRSKQLVKAGEAVLMPVEETLAALTGIPAVAIIAAVETKPRGVSSYAKVISAIQWTVLFGFLAGAAYAVWRVMANAALVAL